MTKKNKQDKGLLSGVFLAYSILIFHALLIGLLFLLIVFFRGIIEHLLQIIIGGIIITSLSGYYFFRKIKKNSGQLKDILNDPSFRGRHFEISILGGVASLKVGIPVNTNKSLEYDSKTIVPQLEDPKIIRLRELQNLSDLFVKGLISNEEFRKLKKELIHEESS